jgi:hypothetical protein
LSEIQSKIGKYSANPEITWNEIELGQVPEQLGIAIAVENGPAIYSNGFIVGLKHPVYDVQQATLAAPVPAQDAINEGSAA